MHGYEAMRAETKNRRLFWGLTQIGLPVRTVVFARRSIAAPFPTSEKIKKQNPPQVLLLLT